MRVGNGKLRWRIHCQPIKFRYGRLGPLSRPGRSRPITVVPLKSKLGRAEQHPPVRRPRAVRGGVQERGGEPHAENRTPGVAYHMREPSRPANPDHLAQDPVLHRPVVQDGPPKPPEQHQPAPRPSSPGWGHRGGRRCHPPCWNRRRAGGPAGAGRQRRTRSLILMLIMLILKQTQEEL